MPDFLSSGFLGTLVAWLLTLMVLSYLLGDNPFFRLATFMFIGVAAGYAGAIAVRNVLVPGIFDPIFEGGLSSLTNLTIMIPLILIILLMFKLSPRLTRYGTLPLAMMVGVGAAVIVGGAITGTLIPQTIAAMDTLNPNAVAPQTGETGLERVANVLILLTGTISTLLYFRFTVSRSLTGETGRSTFMKPVAAIGRGFIALTFGVIFAGAVSASVIILTERVQFLWGFVLNLIPF